MPQSVDCALEGCALRQEGWSGCVALYLSKEAGEEGWLPWSDCSLVPWSLCKEVEQFAGLCLQSNKKVW